MSLLFRSNIEEGKLLSQIRWLLFLTVQPRKSFILSTFKFVFQEILTMSNTIDSPNFLTFPVVFDPFSSYKNFDIKENSSLLFPKREEQPSENPKFKTGDKVQFFTSMVCHHVKFNNQDAEIATDKSENTDVQSGRVSKEEKHPLGKFIFSIQVHHRDGLENILSSSILQIVLCFLGK